MAEFVKVAALSDVPPGTICYTKIGEEYLSVVNVDGTVYAVSDFCSHAYCNLSDGWMEDDAIVCPCHDSRFSVKTGEVLTPPATEPIPTFDVLVEGDDILVAPKDGE